KNHIIELAGVLESGEVAEQKDVQVTVYKVDRRWWFDRYSGDEYNYLNTGSFRKHREETVSLSQGRGSITLNVEKENWGRYLIRVEDKESGHSAAQFIFFDWPYWMRTNRTEGEAATILGFSADKETYNPGDFIKISFPSPKEGRALVTIENGTSVLEKKWIQTTEGETKVEIPVTGDMAPNAYVHVSLIQPHDQTINDRPIRMFGVIPITVEDPATILNPELKLPDVIRPEESFSVEVSEKNGNAMTYTLAVVDEGLLDLTNFKTPDPHGYFYAHEALGVRTWDYYDHVVGAIRTLNSGILSIGGDEEAADPSKQKARRFKPVVHHLGPFELVAGKVQKHKIDMPNYVGSVRVMVVAGKGDAFGNIEKTVPVRSELMVLGTLPRVLGPGETISVPVNVFAMEAGSKDVTVSIKPNQYLLSEGVLQKTIHFDKPGEQMVFFELKTAEAEGIAKLSITAAAGKMKSTYQAEVQLRSPNPVYSVVRDTVIMTGNKWSETIDYFGIAGTNEAALEVSKLPSIRLEKRLGYLMGYPHGCVEQMTSKAFPQLYLGKFVSLTSSQQVEVADNVDFVLRQLRNFQISGGGFSYWPGLSYSNDWGSSYAGHFMLAAEEAGYSLPMGMKRDWINYQKRQTGAWISTPYTSRSYSQRIQAYRLLTLAMANEADFGAMNTLRERSNLDHSSKWILALAYATAGRSKEALDMIQALPKNIDDYTELGYSYGSSTRDEAFVLMTLHKLDQAEEAAPVARSLAKKLGSENFYSTQTTAMTLLALASYLGEYNDNGLIFDLNVAENSTRVETGKPVHSTHFVEGDNGKSLSVESHSDQVLYATLTTSGRPAEGREKKINSNLSMEVNYLDSNFDPMDVSSLEKGTDLVVEVVITNPKNRTLKEMALIHGIPSGWEILNSRLSGMTDKSTITPEYQDIRDAKVMTYFDLEANKKIRLYARVNASYSGRFYLPAIVCYAMYDESIISVEPGKWIEVK
ncbi:MAG TPA: alpha-2-macroglobulin family protein, partial [Cryomorphaceae bacterium]|nr:alpha-2-macroglobulin family protein [Cryomorphaceae bacterium]